MPVYCRFLIVCLQLLLPVYAQSDDEPLTLTDIAGAVVGDSTLITLAFSRAPRWQEVNMQSRNNLLELQLPNTVAPAAGKIQAIDSPFVANLLPLQRDAQTTSLRVFASTAGKRLQQATTVEVVGKQVIILVDHRKLSPLSPPPRTAAHENGWLAKTQLAAVVVVIVLTLLLCLFGLRRLFLQQAQRTHDTQNQVLRRVGKLSLSPRQHLALIEVYGQRLLFAVSRQRTELLTSTSFKCVDDRQRSTMPAALSQLDNDAYLNQNSLSAQKSIQRNQHYRETLPRTAEHRTAVAQNGVR